MDIEGSSPSTRRPTLYHAPSSYYSMIARFALAEARIEYDPVIVDIHIRMTQQSPSYVRINPGMTVPTLVVSGRNLDQSREIAEFAIASTELGSNPEIRSWVDLHYSFSIEELTFGGFLASNPLARFVIPKRLNAARRRLLAMANQHPDLATAYRDRAAVFTERLRVFNPQQAIGLAKARRIEAVGLLDQLEQRFADGRAVVVPPSFSVADVVWTVFLARMEFAGLAAEVERRPALVRYRNAMRARPSFAQADIWTKLHVMRMVEAILGFGPGSPK